MTHEVKIVREGRGGLAYYKEAGITLPFDWDVTSDGFEVYVPTKDEWQEFCRQNNAIQFISRREEIIDRLAEGVRIKKAKTAKVVIDDNGISFSFEGDWLHSLTRRVFGV